MRLTLQKHLDLESIEVIMPGSIRSNKKAMKIAYELLKTPKDRQQKNEKKPSIKRLREWYRDNSTHQ